MKTLLSARERREIEDAILEREMDPDFALVADYAAGELDAEAASAVEKRMETDPAFADLAAPVLLAWQAPPVTEPVSREELTRAWLQLRRRAGMPPVAGQSEPAVLDDLAAFQARVERARTRRLRRRVLRAAAVIAFLLVAPYALIKYRAVGGATGLDQELKGFVGIPMDRMQQTTFQPMTNRLPDGSTWMGLEPGTSVSYLKDFRTGRLVYFSGSARFEIAKGKDEFTIHTLGAEITVVGTSFTVATAPDGVTTVKVDDGTVLLRGRFDDPTEHRRVSVLPAGQVGRVKRNAQPEGGLVYDGFRNFRYPWSR